MGRAGEAGVGGVGSEWKVPVLLKSKSPQTPLAPQHSEHF